MSQGPRLLRPDRAQLRWDCINLDSQLPPDHRARMVWSFVEACDLAALRARIKARDDHPGRPATDPAVLLALWLYATIEGLGAARAIERLCEYHAAYRWLCGGVPVNHDMLSTFRRESGELLDGLLTQSLTALIAEGLLVLDEVAIDGTKVEARAGRSALAGHEKLARIEQQVAERVASLKQQIDADPGRAEQDRRRRTLLAAEATARRIARAGERLKQFEAEKAEQAKRDKREAKRVQKVATSDPEVRQMRMADGMTRPAWNVQVATAKGFVVQIEPTERRNDSGLAAGLVQAIKDRCACWPKRLLADATAMTLSDIEALGKLVPEMQVYSPPREEQETITPAAERNRRSQRKREPAVVKAWRARMDSAEGQEVYRRRKLTEHPHAKMKNRGFDRMPLHGLKAVGAVCFLHAIAHNLMHAHWLRSRAAGA